MRTEQTKEINNVHIPTTKLHQLGQLAGGVAHDMNNILSIIEGFARIVQKKLPNDHDAQDDLRHIFTSSSRGASLTRQLLSFSQNRLVIEEVLDLNRILIEQNALLRPLMGDQVKLSVETSVQPIYVKAAEDQITQIIMNLCINARDAMPNGGQVTLSLGGTHVKDIKHTIRTKSKVKNMAMLTVTDTGTGIPDDIKDKIFTPFFTTKAAEMGTGLGLATVFGIVKQLGGDIVFKTTKDKGTTFYVYLPLTRQKPKRQQKPVQQSGSLQGMSVLLVEDEPELRDVNAQLLRDEKMHVYTASHGHAALAILDENPDIDLLITDIAMPHMNGFKLAELLLALKPTLQVIFVSGNPGKYINDKPEEVKDSNILMKPVAQKELINTIKLSLKGLGLAPQQSKENMS